MTGEPNTTLHLSSNDAELFKIFRQYQEPIKALLESGTFDIQNGTATLSFKDKILMHVEVNYQIYKRHHR
jgi:hypothetical protein